MRISADEAVRIEPALKLIRPRLAGATYTAQDESGDANQFARELVRHCRTDGVQFLMSHTVTALRPAGRQVDLDRALAVMHQVDLAAGHGQQVAHLAADCQPGDAALDFTGYQAAAIREAGLRLIDETPRTGIRGSRVAFLHPAATGGVLTEIVQPKETH